MEFLIQYIYLYILTSDSSCSAISSLPRRPCVSYRVNICCIHYMTSLFLNLLLYSSVTITVTLSSDVTDVWQYDHDITLTLILNPRIKRQKEKRKRKLNKKTRFQTLYIWYYSSFKVFTPRKTYVTIFSLLPLPILL